MKFYKLILVLAAVFFAACTNLNTANQTANVAPANTIQTPIDAPKVDELASTKQIYTQKCIKCHKEDGAGGAVQIEDVALKVPTLRDPAEDDTDADYIRKIERGAPNKMPGFKGKLSDEEIKNLVRYIRRDFQPKLN